MQKNDVIAKFNFFYFLQISLLLFLANTQISSVNFNTQEIL